VFDALAPPQTFTPFGIAALEFTASRRESVVFVGSGARMYDIVGKIFPGGLTALMMGWNRRRTAPPPPSRPVEEESSYRSVYEDGTDGAGVAGRRAGTSASSTAGGPLGWASASTWGFQSLGSDSGIWEKV
jgi:hypothetical protein